MEKSKKRAQRRKNNARMLKRAMRVIDSWYMFDYDSWQYRREQPNHYLWARQMRDNMQVCSCAGCGNPRRSYWNGRRSRMTRAECRAEDSFHDQLQEYLTVDPNTDEE